MPYEFYLVLHLIGVFLVVAGLSAMAVHVMNGGDRNYKARKFTGLAHGIGLLLVLVAGFGLLARLGVVGSWPVWVIGKLVVWVILGGLPALIYRKRNLAALFWLSIFVFAGTAAYLAVYKPA